MLPHYEQELKNFMENLALLKSDHSMGSDVAIPALVPAEVTLLNPKSQWIPVSEGQRAISGSNTVIEKIAPELQNMKMLSLNAGEQRENGTTLEFETAGPVKLLVGYFRNDQNRYAKAPTLETDASANLYGQADPVLLNAIQLSDQTAVNIHIY